MLPGETLRFPFVFKSECAGVFTEQWLLETRPVLCGGAALALTLRGVALQEDKYEKQREELEVSTDSKLRSCLFFTIDEAEGCLCVCIVLHCIVLY